MLKLNRPGEAENSRRISRMESRGLRRHQESSEG